MSYKDKNWGLTSQRIHEFELRVEMKARRVPTRINWYLSHLPPTTTKEESKTTMEVFGGVKESRHRIFRFRSLTSEGLFSLF